MCNRIVLLGVFFRMDCSIFRNCRIFMWKLTLHAVWGTLFSRSLGFCVLVLQDMNALPKLAHQNGQFDPVDTQTSRFMLEGAPFGNGGPSCQEKKQKNAALGHLPSSEFFPKIPSRRNLRTEATAATMKSLRRNSWRLGFRVSAGLVLKNAMKGSRIWPFQKLLLGVDRCGWYYSMIFPHLFVILNLFLRGEDHT